MPKNPWRRLLLVCLISLFSIGLVSLVNLYKIPSEPESSIFLGYSIYRHTLAGVFILLLAIILVFTIRIWKSKQTLESLYESLRELSNNQTHFLLTTLVFLVISGATLLFAFSTPALLLFGPIQAIYTRSISLIIWIELLVISLLFIAGAIYFPIWKEPNFFLRWRTLKIFWYEAILLLSGIHLMIIVLRDAVLASFPYWWGNFLPPSFSIRDFIFILILGIAGLIILELYRARFRLNKLIIILLFGLGCFLSFGYMQGDINQWFRVTLSNSLQDKFAVEVTKTRSMVDMIRNYEDLYGSGSYFTTKPPGTLAIYQMFEYLATPEANGLTHQDRYLRLINFSALVFPILSLSSLALIYLTCRELLFSETTASMMALLLAATSNFNLMQLQLDQFLFMPIFLFGLWIIVKSVNTKSYLLAMAGGVWIFLAIFLSFSLLPLIVISAAYLCLAFGLNKNPNFPSRKQLVLIGLAIFIGFTLAALILWFTFSYNPIIRYRAAMAHHRTMKLFDPGIYQLVEAIAQNTLEFMFWIGVPIYLFAISRVIRGVRNLVKSQGYPVDLLAVSFGLGFIGLNLFGQTRGEVARIWLFLLPMFLLFAVDELQRAIKQNYLFLSSLILVIYQLSVTYMLFKSYSYL